MNKTDTFQYTRRYLKKIEDSAREEIGRLGGNELLEGYLDYLEEGVQEGIEKGNE